MLKNFSGVGNDMRIENHLEWLCDRMVEKNSSAITIISFLHLREYKWRHPADRMPPLFYKSESCDSGQEITCG